ncbi:hypothetical protein [Streptomyces sp. Tue6028]|uniref:hypothetical protein n=1 Tax=Streptomyces sp. Tue6028 TaxID=2036037 RepID=UPI003D76149E
MKRLLLGIATAAEAQPPTAQEYISWLEGQHTWEATTTAAKFKTLSRPISRSS